MKITISKEDFDAICDAVFDKMHNARLSIDDRQPSGESVEELMATEEKYKALYQRLHQQKE